MKKITTLFFLLFLMFLVIKSNQNNDDVILVNSFEDGSYQKLYLKFDDNSLTTKNFKIYFNENIKIISLYTKKDCNLESVNRYLFRFEKLDNNLNGYTNNYINLIGSSSTYYFNGVPIYIVEVDINNNQLENILRKNNNIKYSDKLFGNYQ